MNGARGKARALLRKPARSLPIGMSRADFTVTGDAGFDPDSGMSYDLSPYLEPVVSPSSVTPPVTPADNDGCEA